MFIPLLMLRSHTWFEWPQARPERVPWTVFQMVACIEVARSQGRGPDIPRDLETDYHFALGKIPDVVGSTACWSRGIIGTADTCRHCRERILPVYPKRSWRLRPDTIQDMLRRKFEE